MPSSITLLKTSCLFECGYDFMFGEMVQNTVSIELGTKVMYNFASVLKVMTMENATWQEAKLETGRDPRMKCSGPVLNSLSSYM